MYDFVITLLLAVFLIIVISLLHKRYYITQYIYFFRAPLIFSVLTIALPILAFGSLKSIALNWFDLDTVGFFYIGLLSTMLAWSYMYQISTLWESIPLRNKLPFRKEDYIQPCDDEQQAPMLNTLWLWMNEPTDKTATLWQYLTVPRIFIFALIFAGPILTAAFLQTGVSGLSLLAAGAGVLAAYIIWAISRYEHYQSIYQPDHWFVKSNTRISQIFHLMLKPLVRFALWVKKKFLSDFFDGLDKANQKRITFNIYRAYRYVLFSAFIYVAVGIVFYPVRDNIFQDNFPPLGYILILLILMSWLLAILTLLFDKFRIPLIMLILIVPLLSPDDHFYDVVPVNVMNDVTEMPHSQTKQTDYHIIVAASGGGISAAYWTAVVLKHLHQEFKENFHVDLISSVSGGSVGAMFYVTALDDRHHVPTDRLDKIVEAAGKSSLGEVGWGLSYPDFWRNTVNWSSSHDRAWAQEQRWLKELNALTPGIEKQHTMQSLGINPKRTLLAMNTTVAETGQRMVFFSRDPYQHRGQGGCNENTWKEQERPFYFTSEFPRLSIPVQTAARLSATFPYVTPVARMKTDGLSDINQNIKDCAVAEYHLADGGYYDNWGIATALDYIKRRYHLLPRARQEKLLLIEIQTNSPVDRPKPVMPGLFAPIKTMLNVRSSTQLNRNKDATDMLKALFLMDESIPHELTNVAFTLSSGFENPEDNLESPLSWHLSIKEKNAIENAIVSDENRKSLQVIDTFLNTP